MTRRSLESRSERAQAALAAIAVNLFLGIAFVTGLALRAERQRSEALETFDVIPPPSPPEPIAEPRPAEEAEAEPAGAAGKKAEASPVVALPTPIPRPSPVVAAPIPGTGNAPSSGNADRGTGPGAGGSGSGSGAGGSGAGGIGTEAKLLGGNRSRLPSSLVRPLPQDGGYAHLLLTVGPAGKVSGCEVLTTSGYGAIDQALCGVMTRNSRWQPARDRAGQPITVKVRYTATWSKH